MCTGDEISTLLNGWHRSLGWYRDEDSFLWEGGWGGGGGGGAFIGVLAFFCWVPQPVVFWWKRFICQHPNGQPNYQCKLISWFKPFTAASLPKLGVWLLNGEKVHVRRYIHQRLCKWMGLSVRKWNKCACVIVRHSMNSNEGKVVSVALTVRIYILSVSLAPNVNLWHCATRGSIDLLSSYRQI